MMENKTSPTTKFGRRAVARKGADFYPTPSWGTKALIKYETFDGSILEPCCGDGAMSEILKETGCPIISSDLYARGYGSQNDFFSLQGPYENIITNPPYNVAEDILEHALKISTKKVALLLRLAFLESIKRYRKFYSHIPPTRVYVFTERLSMYPAGEVIKGGGVTPHAWFIWDKSDTSLKTEIKWIEPGLKKMEKTDGK